MKEYPKLRDKGRSREEKRRKDPNDHSFPLESEPFFAFLAAEGDAAEEGDSSRFRFFMPVMNLNVDWQVEQSGLNAQNTGGKNSGLLDFKVATWFQTFNINDVIDFEHLFIFDFDEKELPVGKCWKME